MNVVELFALLTVFEAYITSPEKQEPIVRVYIFPLHKFHTEDNRFNQFYLLVKY